jgi:HK97 gp10 family phage protein
MDMRITLHGMEELQAALNQLPKSLSKAVLRRALTKAGQPVLHAARAGVPIGEGDLLRSLDIRPMLTKRQRRLRRKAGRGGAADVFIGPTFPMGRHGHLVEFGTVKMGARPFLRPAWDSNKSTVFAIFKKALWSEILAATRRLVKRAAAGTISRAQAVELLGP